jgi:hypothetical protein
MPDGPDEKEFKLFEIEIFYTQVERFSDPQSVTVNQPGDEIGGITRPISNGLEQGSGFRNGGCMTQAGRTFGTQGIHPLQELAEDFLVKVEHGVERLILTIGEPSQ